ncbi:MAG: glycosyltransferase [Chitinophagales bacterium]|nr:glycosyltransferase [Bacteroidota bacterium]
MKLSIVIVNYNVRYFLEQTIASVYKSKVDFPYEIFVVDNHSKDESLKMLAQKFPSVNVIANQENVGFSKANNQAIRQAKGDYVLLLNPDTIIQEDTLQKCINKMESNQNIGGLGVKMVDGAGNFLPESKRGFPSPIAAFAKMSGLAKLFPSSKILGQYHLTYLDKSQSHEVDVLSGAFMLLRKTVLDKVGLLDEDYFMYGEDIDLSYCIRKAGFINYYFADTSIIHFKGESTKKGSLNYIKTFYRAMIIFCDKHISGTKGKVLKILLQFAIFMRALLAVIQRVLQPFGLPILDITCMCSILYTWHLFWENVVKVSEHLIFPSTFFYFNIPIYVAIWFLSMLVLRVYKRQHKWKQLVLSQLIGTLLIAVCYAFFPNSLRTSRGIILFGFLSNLLILSSYRILYHWQNNSLNAYLNIKKRYLIIANEQNANAIVTYFSQTQNKYEYLGYVSLHNGILSKHNLGTIEQLQDIVEAYKPDEILFSTDEITTQFIIETMSKIKIPIVFRLVTQNKTIISSSSKNTIGEVYTFDIDLNKKNPWWKFF